jgi:hypothetical protein
MGCQEPIDILEVSSCLIPQEVWGLGVSELELGGT